MSDGDRSDERPNLGYFGVTTGILLCCLIVSYLAYISGRQDEGREQTPTSYGQAAKEKARSACVGMDANAAFECIYEKVESSQDQAHNSQDLDAQQRAAMAALASAFIAFFAMIATVFGVYYVRRTLEATAEAVKETGKATVAMQKQNDISQDSLRAWVGFQAVDEMVLVNNTINGEFNDIALGFTIAWKNFGSTPAFNLRSHSLHVVLENGANIPDLEINVPDIIGGITGPGLEWKTKPLVLDSKFTKLFRERKITVLLYSKVAYYDVYSAAASPKVERISQILLHAVHGGGTQTGADGRPRDQITYDQIGHKSIMT